MKKKYCILIKLVQPNKTVVNIIFLQRILDFSLRYMFHIVIFLLKCGINIFACSFKTMVIHYTGLSKRFKIEGIN